MSLKDKLMEGAKSGAKKVGGAAKEKAKTAATNAAERTKQAIKNAPKNATKKTLKVTAQKADEYATKNSDLYRGAKKISAQVKGVAKNMKRTQKVLKKGMGFIKFLASKGPIGWIILISIMTAVTGLLNTGEVKNAIRGSESKRNHQEHMVDANGGAIAVDVIGDAGHGNGEEHAPAADYFGTESPTTTAQKAAILDDCGKKSDYNAGEIGEGSGEGSWMTPGTNSYMRAKYIFETLVSLGLSNYTAAGAIGNATIESGHTFHPGITEAAYKDRYNPVEMFEDIGAYISPSAEADSSDPNDHGTAGWGIFQESPGILMKTNDGLNGYKWRDVFGMDSDWKDAVRDRKKIAAALYVQIQYFFLAKTGAGLSSSGYAGLKAAAENNATGAGGHSISEVTEAKNVYDATRAWYWWFEIGDFSAWDAAGGDARVQHAEKALELFRVDGRDEYDPSMLNKITDGITGGGNSNAKCGDTVDRSNILSIALSLVGFWEYGSYGLREAIIPYLDNPIKGQGTTDCSGFVWAVFKMAGYKVPEQMWATPFMQSDSHGPQEYLELIPESEAKAGDAIVHEKDGTGAFPSHTGILMEDWRGPETPIVQEGGVERNVNAGHPASSSIASPYFFVRPKHKAE